MLSRSLAVVASVAILLVACGPLEGDREPPTPTPIPVRQDEGKQVHDVQRGSIYDTIKALGRVVAKEETPLYFKQNGRLRSVNVAILDTVKKGDLLAELDTGDLALRIERARIELEMAQIEHARQVATAQNVRADLKGAAASLVGAQAAVTRAQNELARLESGPRADDLAAAEAAVEAARASYHRAEAQLATIRQPLQNDDVIVVETALAKARAALEKAQADYDRIGWRPEAAGSPQAVALRQATADFEAAQAAYNVRMRAARPEDLAVAESAARSALETLRSAEARLAQVRNGARGEDVAAARIAVEKAQSALADTRAAYAGSEANARIDVGNFDIAMAAKKVDLARVKHAGLQEELEMARIRAPFSGVVTFMTGKKGEQFQAFAPLVILSNPEKIEVSAEFQGTELGRIRNGQDAIVLTDAFGKQELKGKVVRLPSTEPSGTGPQGQGNPRAVRIAFEIPGPGITLGQLAQVSVITQQKDDILLIPNTAVRRFGSRTYVQLLVDGRRRDVDVATGLVTETDTEITKGLREGQKVIVP